MLNTNYNHTISRDFVQSFVPKTVNQDMPDFASLLAQMSNPKSESQNEIENPALANLSESERAAYSNFMTKREEMLAGLDPTQRASVEQFSYFAQLDEQQKVRYALLAEKYGSEKYGNGLITNFAFEMHESGLGDVADSMITTAQKDGTMKQLHLHLLLESAKNFLEKTGRSGLAEPSEANLEDYELQPIVNGNIFMGLGKNDILNHLKKMFENPLHNDDFDKQLANNKFAQSMLDSIRNAIA